MSLSTGFWLAGSIVSIFTGIVVYANRTYLNKPAGIKNNGVWHRDFTNRGNWAWMMGVYTDHILYCFVLVSRILRTESRRWKSTGIVGFFDPSYILNGKAASQWFVYGTLYTIAIVGLGYKFILKYLYKYQLVRTLSVMFFNWDLLF
jgi:hypothetical protein